MWCFLFFLRNPIGSCMRDWERRLSRYPVKFIYKINMWASNYISCNGVINYICLCQFHNEFIELLMFGRMTMKWYIVQSCSYSIGKLETVVEMNRACFCVLSSKDISFCYVLISVKRIMSAPLSHKENRNIGLYENSESNLISNEKHIFIYIYADHLLL